MRSLPVLLVLAIESMVEIISRARWGARHPNGFGFAPLPAAEVWLHHSVTLAPDLVWIDTDRDGVEDDEEKAMRLLEDIGQSRFGGGISYTWLIPPSGRIYEGHSVDRQGSHTVNRNSISRAICFIGNYDISKPTQAQIRSSALLLRDAKAAGWIAHPRLTGGHRDLKSTACPGQYAYQAIPLINTYQELDMPDSPMVSDLAFRVADFVNQNTTQTGGEHKGDTLPMVRDLVALLWRVEALVNARVTIHNGPTAGEEVPLVKMLNQINEKLDVLLADS
jgi:hypothetical protein